MSNLRCGEQEIQLVSAALHIPTTFMLMIKTQMKEIFKATIDFNNQRKKKLFLNT
jgi:hypothetical protein